MLALVSGCFSELQPTSRPDSGMLPQCCNLSSDVDVATSFDRKGLTTETEQKREKRDLRFQMASQLTERGGGK